MSSNTYYYIRYNLVPDSEEDRLTRPRGVEQALSDMPDVDIGRNGDNGRGRRFTNTAVPRFDGRGCWQQHLLIFQAIVKSNGWSPVIPQVD